MSFAHKFFSTGLGTDLRLSISKESAMPLLLPITSFSVVFALTKDMLRMTRNTPNAPNVLTAPAKPPFRKKTVVNALYLPDVLPECYPRA
jgi:hypothetical protein